MSPRLAALQGAPHNGSLPFRPRRPMPPPFDWTFGYPLAIGLMVVSAVIPWVYFKRKKWV